MRRIGTGFKEAKGVQRIVPHQRGGFSSRRRNMRPTVPRYVSDNASNPIRESDEYLTIRMPKSSNRTLQSYFSFLDLLLYY
ncbi:MAG: hypothetical protein QXY49_02425, partial [Thermofilaceae archaeon]